MKPFLKITLGLCLARFAVGCSGQFNHPACVSYGPYATRKVLNLSPSQATLGALQNQKITLLGSGTPPYIFSIDLGGVGSIDSEGNYSRPWFSTQTTVRLTDADCNQGTSVLNLEPSRIQFGAPGGTVLFYGIETDSEENLYTLGQTTSASFGDQLFSHGTTDTTFAKFDSLGRKIWAKQIGAGGVTNVPTYSRPWIDSNGYAYVTGQTSGTAFGTQLGVHGTADFFLMKLDLNGNLLWSVQYGKPLASGAISIWKDSSGDHFLVGTTSSTTFGTQLGTHGSTDIALLKIDSAGNFVWAVQQGGGGVTTSSGRRVIATASGKLYVIGHTESGTLGTQLMSHGQVDLYVSQLDQNGNLLWTKQLGAGSSTSVYGYDGVMDSEGSIYVVGYTDASNLGTQLGINGSKDVMVTKISSAGELLWARQIGAGASTTSVVFSSLVDSSNNLYVSGHTTGTMGTLQGTHGSNDALLIKMSSDGKLLWSRQVGPGEGFTANGRHLTLFQDTTIFQTGFSNNPNFGKEVNQAGPAPGFILKWDKNGNLQ